jgi:NAD(P)-dependent dehydrogenase (short-subunit alcohol dehydrogenase family)
VTPARQSRLSVKDLTGEKATFVDARRAATKAREGRIFNNARAIFGTRKLTEDGLERTFALNHMGYFVLTEGLRERLLASSIGERLRRGEALRALEALQHPIHTRT